MEIISIIQEELNKFIDEVREYNDDDIINTNDINLQHEYDKLNQLLFGGQLPKVPLEWSNRRTALGHVRSLYNRGTGEVKIEYLAMSKFFATPYRVFKDVLAHEMIHVKTISEGKRDIGGKHGYYFNNEANRINSMGLGFHITDKNSEQLEMSAHAVSKVKPMIAILLNIDGKYGLMRASPALYAAQGIDSIANLFQHLVNHGKYRKVEITVIETSNPQVFKVPEKRDLRRGATYIWIDDALLGQIIEDKILKNVVIERDKPPIMSEEENQGDWEVIDIV